MKKKKEYKTPEFVYVEFAYSDVVVASMDIGGGTGKSEEDLR